MIKIVKKQKNNLLKQPLAIAIVLVLAVTMIAVGMNSFTGNASWFSKFSRAPVRIERPVQVEAQRLVPRALGRQTGRVSFAESLDFAIEAYDGRFDDNGVDDVTWRTETINYNGYADISINSGLTKDLYFTEAAALRNDADRISVKTISIRSEGQNDDGLLVHDLNSGEWFETDSINLAVERDGSLGVYRQEAQGSDSIRAFTVSEGNQLGEVYIVTTGDTRTRVNIKWG